MKKSTISFLLVMITVVLFGQARPRPNDSKFQYLENIGTFELYDAMISFDIPGEYRKIEEMGEEFVNYSKLLDYKISVEKHGRIIYSVDFVFERTGEIPEAVSKYYPMIVHRSKVILEKEKTYSKVRYMYTYQYRIIRDVEYKSYVKVKRFVGFGFEAYNTHKKKWEKIIFVE